MEHQDLVAAVPQEAKRLERQVAVEQQVGDEHDQPAAPELVHHPAERRLRGGALAGLEVAQGLRAAGASGSAAPGAGARCRTSSSKVMSPVASRWRSSTRESAAISRWA